jgi:pimeloyl-ACP methyl ester carboxylesterase
MILEPGQGAADRVISPAELAFMAKRAGAHITELNVGHLSMIANPETVAQVIEQAATETT